MLTPPPTDPDSTLSLPRPPQASPSLSWPRPTRLGPAHLGSDTAPTGPDSTPTLPHTASLTLPSAATAHPSPTRLHMTPSNRALRPQAALPTLHRPLLHPPHCPRGPGRALTVLRCPAQPDPALRGSAHRSAAPPDPARAPPPTGPDSTLALLRPPQPRLCPLVASAGSDTPLLYPRLQSVLPRAALPTLVRP